MGESENTKQNDATTYHKGKKINQNLN